MQEQQFNPALGSNAPDWFRALLQEILQRQAASAPTNSAQATWSTPVLSTVAQFAERHPSFTEPSLRHLIFESKPRRSSKGQIEGNGLDRAIVRVGRKVLIDEAKFFDWLAAQNEQVSK